MEFKPALAIKTTWKLKRFLQGNRVAIFLYKEFLFRDLPPFYRIYFPCLSLSIVDSRGTISHENKFIYFRVPKAANSTIIASLYYAQSNHKILSLNEIQVIKDRFYVHPSQLSVAEVKELQRSYFKFTFVRNPFTRLLSAYRDKILPKKEDKHKMVAKFLGKDETSDLSLDDFLTYLEAGGIHKNAHWAKQVNLIPILIKEINFIGKTESLNEDLSHVLEVIFADSKPIVSIQEHATKVKQGTFQLDSVSERRIYRLYEEDFDVFEYDKTLSSYGVN